MIVYSVTIWIDAAIEAQWLEWMTRVHVPDVMQTGCFLECRTYKLLERNETESSYVLQYRCGKLEEYERYRDNFAAVLQKDHTERFRGRFRASRQLLEEVVTVTTA